MATNTINFDESLTEEEIDAASALGSERSGWVKTLTILHEGVKEGRGEYGKFYPVGQFKGPNGAQTALHNIEKNFADQLPAEFLLRKVVNPIDSDGNRSSTLWAAVVAPDDTDETDELVDGNTDTDEDTADEAPTKPRGARKRS